MVSNYTKQAVVLITEVPVINFLKAFITKVSPSFICMTGKLSPTQLLFIYTEKASPQTDDVVEIVTPVEFENVGVVPP